MGRRWTARGLSGERYCGNMTKKEVHDLDHENTVCHIDEIIRKHDVIPFRTLDCAHDQGYHDCPYCFRNEEKHHSQH